VRRYALLTVDTEALPRRASDDHVSRLVWGQHDSGVAGVREMCAIGDEFGAKQVFFVDLCAAYSRLGEMQDVVRWLHAAGQDVQLHAHPEVLPEEFWRAQDMDARPALMNEYRDDARAEFVIRYFGGLIREITGQDLRAFRAGSFRWNACTIRALKAAGVSLSFNNSMRARAGGQCVFSEPTNLPYAWSNGVVEVPVTERLVPGPPGARPFWSSLTYPESPYFPFEVQRLPWLKRIFGRRPEVCVFLLHSWSLLNWDENGHAVYRDDQRLEAYRKLMARIAKDYDVITTREFLDLYARGEIEPTHTVGVERAEFVG